MLPRDEGAGVLLNRKAVRLQGEPQAATGRPSRLHSGRRHQALTINRSPIPWPWDETRTHGQNWGGLGDRTPPAVPREGRRRHVPHEGEGHAGATFARVTTKKGPFSRKPQGLLQVSEKDGSEPEEGPHVACNLQDKISQEQARYHRTPITLP